jgi:hypothetical protein
MKIEISFSLFPPETIFQMTLVKLLPKAFRTRDALLAADENPAKAGR